jgi:hypothetical protein
MLPLLSIFSLGMSGVEELGAENDGIVETRSMVAPEAAAVGQITDKRFSRQAPTCTQNKGIYWHFGTNEGIDHADQVGGFTNDDTVRRYLSQVSLLIYIYTIVIIESLCWLLVYV